VDSYRQFAGEALVTLNFSKKVFHGLVYGLFVTEWVESDGPRKVHLWIGIIQLTVLVYSAHVFVREESESVDCQGDLYRL
jgi:hypothetical protein